MEKGYEQTVLEAEMFKQLFCLPTYCKRICRIYRREKLRPALIKRAIPNKYES